MRKIYFNISFIVLFTQILSENQIKSNKIINKFSKNINKSYINKHNINFKLRNTGLLDLLDGTVAGLLDVVNSTVDGLLDTLLGDDSNDNTQNGNTNTNNNNENNDSNDNNNNENENQDLNNDNNNDSNNNKETTINNNNKDETKHNTEKTRVIITDTSVTIKV